MRSATTRTESGRTIDLRRHARALLFFRRFGYVLRTRITSGVFSWFRLSHASLLKLAVPSMYPDTVSPGLSTAPRCVRVW